MPKIAEIGKPRLLTTKDTKDHRGKIRDRQNKPLLHPAVQHGRVKADGRLALLHRSERLLMERWLALGRGLERKYRTYRHTGFVGHDDKVGGVGLQVGDGGTVIVAVQMLDSADRPLLQVIAVRGVVQIRVSASF